MKDIMIPIKKEDFLKIYRNLEVRVMFELRETINKSDYISKHTNTKAINVNIEFYEELTVINGNLFFIDGRGLHYNFFTVSLDCAIGILNKNNL